MSALRPETLLRARSNLHQGEASAPMRERVTVARRFAMERQQMPNARLSGEPLLRHGALSRATSIVLHRAVKQMGLSARAMTRTVQVARTIADLAGAPAITTACIAEALQYRRAGTVNPSDSAISPSIR